MKKASQNLKANSEVDIIFKFNPHYTSALQTTKLTTVRTIREREINNETLQEYYWLNWGCTGPI